MRALKAATIAITVGLMTVACGGSDGTSPDNGGDGGGGGQNVADMITLKGIVYGQANTGSGCNPACSFVNPLPGAEVGTSLDGVKITTDSQGRFTLTTQTKSFSKCTEFMVNITAIGYTPYHVAGAWGNHSERNFALAPPIPAAGGVGGC
jgi:hypothetical protein